MLHLYEDVKWETRPRAGRMEETLWIRCAHTMKMNVTFKIATSFVLIVSEGLWVAITGNLMRLRLYIVLRNLQDYGDTVGVEITMD